MAVVAVVCTVGPVVLANLTHGRNSLRRRITQQRRRRNGNGNLLERRCDMRWMSSAVASSSAHIRFHLHGFGLVTVSKVIPLAATLARRRRSLRRFRQIVFDRSWFRSAFMNYCYYRQRPQRDGVVISKSTRRASSLFLKSLNQTSFHWKLSLSGSIAINGIALSCYWFYICE